MATIYVIRTFGGVLMLTIGPVVVPLPTLLVVATFRDGLVLGMGR